MIGKKKAEKPPAEAGAGVSEHAGAETPAVDGSAEDLPTERDADAQDVELLLEDARAKADQHWDRCLRLQAELENLHKRNQRDLENAHKYGLEKISAALLPVRDSLEMGLGAAGQDNVDGAKLKEGTELTLKLLTMAMEKFGIQEVNPEGQRFNPEFHQAMSAQERGDMEPNMVVAVVQKGYLLQDRLIRPAMVIVSRAVAQPAGPKIDEQA